MHPIIRLVNRNLTISLNPGFLIWQVIFPLIYIFVAGFAYAPLIQNVPLGARDLDYPAFLLIRPCALQPGPRGDRGVF